MGVRRQSGRGASKLAVLMQTVSRCLTLSSIFSVVLFQTWVILYLTGLNHYGIVKPFSHLISMCMCSQCDSTSLPGQRSQILF